MANATDELTAGTAVEVYGVPGSWTDCPADILDVEEIRHGARVRWQDDDVDAPLIHSADLEIEWQSADRSCGLEAGYCVSGDAPEWILDYVARWAMGQASGRADYASELRAELRAEAGW
jgi:hypothetical protein